MKRGNRVELNLGYAQMERLEKAAQERGISPREFVQQAVEITLADHFSVTSTNTAPRLPVAVRLMSLEDMT